MNADDVLQFLDGQAKASRFLTLDNYYWNYSRAKLHTYASPDDWILTFQVCAYFQRTRELGNFCYIYGPSLNSGRQVTTLRVLHSGDRDVELNDRYHFILMFPSGPEICEPTEKDYRAYKIPATSENPPILDIVRLVGWKYSDRVFLGTPELDIFLASLGLVGFNMLLDLDDWYHPNVALEEPPSKSRSMRQIADVIASNDPSKYTLGGKGNTHWRKWPGT